MNLINLVSGHDTVPESSEGMVNLLLQNAFCQLQGESEKAEYWRNKYHDVKDVLDNIFKSAEYKRNTYTGNTYISLQAIYDDDERYDFDWLCLTYNLKEAPKKEEQKNDTVSAD